MVRVQVAEQHGVDVVRGRGSAGAARGPRCRGRAGSARCARARRRPRPDSTRRPTSGRGRTAGAADDGDPHESVGSQSRRANWAAVDDLGPEEAPGHGARTRSGRRWSGSGAPASPGRPGGSGRARRATGRRPWRVSSAELTSVTSLAHDVGDRRRSAAGSACSRGSACRRLCRNGGRGTRERPASSSAPPVTPASTNSTNRGQAWLVTRDSRRGSERVVVGSGARRRLRPDDADPAVARGRDRPADGRPDHLDDRHVVPLARVAQHGRTRGVAGDDEQLDALGRPAGRGTPGRTRGPRRSVSGRTAAGRCRRGRRSTRGAAGRARRGPP